MVLLEALVQRKSLVLILVKQVPNFSWVGIIMMIIVICLLMKKKSVSLKPIMKVLGSIPNGFAVTESREVSLKGNVWFFSRFQWYW